MPLRIAIDGPSGAGKSTTAKMLAERLGIAFLSTGELYRAVGYLVLESRRSALDAAFANVIAQKLEPLIVDGHVVSANGIDMVGRLKEASISRAASDVSKHPGVRAALLKVQQDYALEHGAVMEGRDIGTVVMPDADLKIFLTSDVAERSRRLRELGNFESETQLVARDKQDSERPDAPLAQAADAFLIDNTYMSVGEVVEEILRLLKARAWSEQARVLKQRAQQGL